VKCYGVQPNIKWEQKSANYEQVRALLHRSRPQPGSLVVLPEMFATGFSMHARVIAEGRRSPTTEFLRTLARQHRVCVVGGMVRARGPGAYVNEAVAVGPTGRLRGHYDKIQLFGPGRETEHYQPGNELALFRWGRFQVALFICYDLRFPELFRLAARRGADVMVVIANWPSRRAGHWKVLLQARAIENQAFVVGVNRCGEDPQHRYAGGSLLLDPRGNVLAEAGTVEGLIEARLNRRALVRWRREFPALRDIRTRMRLGQPGGGRAEDGGRGSGRNQRRLTSLNP